MNNITQGLLLGLIIANILFLTYQVYRLVDKRKVVNKCKAVISIIRNDEYTSITRRGNHYNVSYGKVQDIEEHIEVLKHIYPNSHHQNDPIQDFIDELPQRMN